jgi:hypothetical protein
MTEVHHRTFPGVVLMVDLDNYLDRVRHMTPNAEWTFVAPIYRSAEALATKHHLHLVRIFGDGFLLYGEGQPDQKQLRNAIRFLVELQATLEEKAFRFKAAIVGGAVVLSERRSATGEIETVLAGATANVAGKAIRRAARGTLELNWPASSAALDAETFETITGAATRRTASVSIAELTPDGDPFVLPPTPKSDTATPAEISAFSSSVKGVAFDTIKMADDKAKAIFAVSGGFLVYLFNGRANPAEFFVACGASHLVRLGSWIAAMLLFIASAVFALLVLYPRTGTSHRGLLFYGSIRLWGSSAAYADRLKELSPADLARESAIHNFDVSGVAVQKYTALRRSIWLMASGILVALLFLGIQWILFPPAKL